MLWNLIPGLQNRETQWRRPISGLQNWEWQRTISGLQNWETLTASNTWSPELRDRVAASSTWSRGLRDWAASNTWSRTEGQSSVQYLVQNWVTEQRPIPGLLNWGKEWQRPIPGLQNWGTEWQRPIPGLQNRETEWQRPIPGLQNWETEWQHLPGRYRGSVTRMQH